MQEKKNIIVSCDTFMTGGAETFALRMARYYKEKGHNVFLFSVLGDRIDYNLVKENAGDIQVFSYKPAGFLNWCLYKIDGLLYRFGKFNTFRRQLTVKKCKRLIADHNIQVVHTNMFASLDIFNHALENNPDAVSIHSVHADILGLAHAELVGKKEKLSNYDQFCIDSLLPQIFSRVNYVVATAEMHLKIFKTWGRFSSEKLQKIYNPVDRKKEETKDSFSRSDLNISESAFVFGSMARCVKEKGWGELIEAFISLNLPDSHLVLIGDGVYLKELKDKYGADGRILFVGNQPAPLKYLKLFDVAISPSYFWESLPTAIIDYMSIGIPVICTDNAESRYMIQSGNESAGITVPLTKDEWDVIVGENPLKVDHLAAAMSEMYRNPEKRSIYSKNGFICFKKFDKDHIVSQYSSLFKKGQA